MAAEVKYERPPHGIVPRWLHDEQRRDALEATMQRFADANYPINQDWVKEFNELEERCEKRNKEKKSKCRQSSGYLKMEKAFNELKAVCESMLADSTDDYTLITVESMIALFNKKFRVKAFVQKSDENYLIARTYEVFARA